MKPCDSTLGQPLWMAIHAGDWGNPSKICHRSGKRYTIVTMFVGGVVSVVNGILVLFLPYKTYGAGVFVPAQT